MTRAGPPRARPARSPRAPGVSRSEEHTSELQSRSDLVCRLLLEKKKKTSPYTRRIYSSTFPAYIRPRILSALTSSLVFQSQWRPDFFHRTLLEYMRRPMIQLCDI